jgi:hypothetical protein
MKRKLKTLTLTTAALSLVALGSVVFAPANAAPMPTTFTVQTNILEPIGTANITQLAGYSYNVIDMSDGSLVMNAVTDATGSFTFPIAANKNYIVDEMVANTTPSVEGYVPIHQPISAVVMVDTYLPGVYSGFNRPGAPIANGDTFSFDHNIQPRIKSFGAMNVGPDGSILNIVPGQASTVWSTAVVDVSPGAVTTSIFLKAYYAPTSVYERTCSDVPFDSVISGIDGNHISMENSGSGVFYPDLNTFQATSITVTMPLGLVWDFHEYVRAQVVYPGDSFVHEDNQCGGAPRSNLTGSVFSDVNGNGVIESSETPLTDSNGTVSLVDSTDAVVASAPIAPNGSYSIPEVVPGAYTAAFEIPGVGTTTKSFTVVSPTGVSSSLTLQSNKTVVQDAGVYVLPVVVTPPTTTTTSTTVAAPVTTVPSSTPVTTTVTTVAPVVPPPATSTVAPKPQKPSLPVTS